VLQRQRNPRARVRPIVLTPLGEYVAAAMCLLVMLGTVACSTLILVAVGVTP
jgi:hypothetical protein